MDLLLLGTQKLIHTLAPPLHVPKDVLVEQKCTMSMTQHMNDSCILRLHCPGPHVTPVIQPEHNSTVLNVTPCSADYKYKPVRRIAEASTAGHGINIIAGVAVGLEATALPVIVMSTALVAAYWLGNTSGEAY
jgi:Na+/H+-translocating membrane pyrophosphatase